MKKLLQLSAETIVQLRLSGAQVDVPVRGERTVDDRVGEQMPIRFDLASTHPFDPATTRRIT